MRNLYALITASVTIATASPASAVVYSGQFSGVVTKGYHSVDALFDCGGCQSYVDLTGRAMTLSFRTEIVDGYDPVDFSSGRFISSSVNIAIAGGYGISTSGTNSPFLSATDRATYRGNDQTAVATTFYMPNNYYYSASFHFGLPTSGSRFFGFGSAVADQTGWSPSLMILTTAQFRLTEGIVTTAGGPVSAAPEPQAWALMTAGVGLIGAIARLSRRRTGRKAAHV